MTEKLSVDEKWCIEYDHENNDKPVAWWRHNEYHRPWIENNAVTALFYALLDIKHYGAQP